MAVHMPSTMDLSEVTEMLLPVISPLHALLRFRGSLGLQAVAPSLTLLFLGLLSRFM